MRHLSLFLSLLVLLTGCDALSPFIGEDLKFAICDRDSDGRARTSDYCGGDDCDDGDQNVGEPSGWFRDVDADTFGAGQESFSCSQPDGYVDHNGDCDDTDELINPDGIETCNGYDDNCDDLVDDQNITVWYADLDEDTYGDPAVTLQQCDEPEGYIDNALDCDDTDELINPDGTEVCDDGIDQDCNGIVDDADGSQTWYADLDEDGYGNAEDTLDTCVQNPVGYVDNDEDCDDNDGLVNPAAAEICNDLVDNNCNGQIDTDTEDIPWYRDADEDGYGDEVDSQIDCAPPDGYVQDATDCNDSETLINPGVEEICNNGIDDNCNSDPDGCVLTGGTVSVSTSDTTLTGESAGANAAYNMGGGDVDGDGIVDLLVGAPGEDNSAGVTYVLLGPVSLGTISLADADLKLTGEVVGDQAGWTVAGGGDLNNDGIDDLFIGAYGVESDTGAVYVFFGSVSVGEVSLANADVTFTGESAGDRIGWSLDVDGDVNNDGIDDVIVGAPGLDSGGTDTGGAYVVFGPVSGGEISMTSADVRLESDSGIGSAGWSVSNGDVNNDGIDDVIVGAAGDAGGVFITLGPISTDVSLVSSDILLTGVESGDSAGQSIARCDINGDGNVDLVVGASGQDSGGSGTGATYILLGPLSTGENSLSVADVVLTGEGTDDSSGRSVACGDVDDDGIDDLVIGAQYESSVGTYTGAAYLVLGSSTLASGSLGSMSYQKWTGVNENDYCGHFVGIQNVTDDPTSDVLIGCYLFGSTDAGSGFVINGLGY